MAIRLEQPTAPPVDAIGTLEKKIRGNRYALDVLRQIVARHLYLFNVRQPIRQQLASLLDLKVDESKALDQRVKRS